MSSPTLSCRNVFWPINRTMSPSLTTSELGNWIHRLSLDVLVTPYNLAYQLRIARPSIYFVHIDCLPILFQAGASVNLPADRIIVLDARKTVPHRSLDELIRKGIDPPHFIPRRLFDGEAKKKIAFLAFSSGTTGKPKVKAAVPRSQHWLTLCSGSCDHPLQRY